MESDPSPSPSGLGRGMVARTRPRLGVPHRLQRRGAIGMIGMIGRSTIGFGRIIASAGSARPTVTAGNLTSLSLRPPHAFWSGWAAGEPEPAQQPARSWTTAAAGPRPQARRTAQPEAVATPKAKSAAPIVQKVDSLRRLLEQSGMIEPSADQPPEPAEPETTVGAEQPAARSFGDRSSTSAGPTTAPGELARRSRPEAGATGGQEGLSVEFPDRPHGTTRRASGPAPSASSGIDRFRDALSSRGLIEPTTQPAATPATPAGSVDPIARRQNARPQRQRRSSATDRAPSRSTSTPQIRRSATRSDGATGSDDPDGPGGPGPERSHTESAGPDNRDDTGTVAMHWLDERPSSEHGLIAATALPLSLLPEAGWVDRQATMALVGPPGAAFDVGTTREATRRSAADRPTSATVTPATTTTTATTTTATMGRLAPRAQVSPAPRIRRSVEQHAADSDRPVTATSDADPAVARSTVAVNRVTRPIDQRLRDLGLRVGLPHTRSDERRPESTLSAMLAAPPTVTVRVDPAAPGASPAIRRSETSVTDPRRPDRRFVEFADPDARRLPRPGSFLSGTPDANVTSNVPDDQFASTQTRSVVSPGPGALQRAIAELRSPADRPPEPGGRRARRPDPEPTTAAVVPNGQTRRRPRSARHDHAAPLARPDGTQPDAASEASHRDASADAAQITSAAADRTVAPTNVVAAPDRISRSVDRSVASPEAGLPSQQSLADRFLTELRRRPPAATQPLPAAFQPLAAAITGTASQVRIATDATTRTALRTVGKRAATVGDVIHLDRSPQQDMRASEVLAHELTHVAHPSPLPRFFDDDHRGPEERMAEQVANVIARSPVMPAAKVPSQTTTSGGQMIRRSPAATSSGGQSAGTISAAGLAAAIEQRTSAIQSPRGSTPAGADSVVRRSPAAGIRSSSSTTSDQVIRREEIEHDSGSGGPEDEIALPADSRMQRQWFEQMVNQSIDHILRRLEDRVIIDLERRGGRHWRNL